MAIPNKSYGVLTQDQFGSQLDEIAEEVKRLGYAILDSGYSKEKINKISNSFENAYVEYVRHWGKKYLNDLSELHTIRALLTHDLNIFLELATNPNLLGVIEKLIKGKFILNQQNGIINPPGEEYAQGEWHRDLPYQHFTSSSPLAINAIFCIDDFTPENGSTFVLPSSHKSVNFPSKQYLLKNALQINAKAGQYIILDCMLFHSGGYNNSLYRRRGINHVYTIPYLKQQINLPKNIDYTNLSSAELALLGFKNEEPVSIKNYLESRLQKVKANE